MDNLDQLETLSENSTSNTLHPQVTAPEMKAMDDLVRSNQSPKVPVLTGKPFKIGV